MIDNNLATTWTSSEGNIHGRKQENGAIHDNDAVDNDKVIVTVPQQD